MSDLHQLLAGDGSQQLSAGMHILLVLTLLSLAPAMLVLTTAFTRILIVLGFLRHALGTPNTPPNMVLIPLAGFLALLAMGPVLDRVYSDALQPAWEGKLQPLEAYKKAAEPLRAFMLANTRTKDLSALAAAAHLPALRGPEDVPDRLLVPAFALSELRVAFQMGFTLFLGFLAVDLVVAGLLISLGMFMVPPTTIALPVKLILFVLVDGWALISRSLIGSFHMPTHF